MIDFVTAPQRIHEGIETGSGLFHIFSGPLFCQIPGNAEGPSQTNPIFLRLGEQRLLARVILTHVLLLTQAFNTPGSAGVVCFFQEGVVTPNLLKDTKSHFSGALSGSFGGNHFQPTYVAKVSQISTGRQPLA